MEDLALAEFNSITQRPIKDELNSEQSFTGELIRW